MIGCALIDLVLAPSEAEMIRQFRASDEQTRDHIARLTRRLAEKFPERQRPTLRLVLGRVS